MSLDGNVLVLKLAHDHGGRTDGGILSVNPTTRVISWHGIEGEVGCKETLDVPFEKVRSVRTAEGAGFVLTLHDHAKMVFLPAVDADWFARQETTSVADAGFNSALKQGLITFAVGGRHPDSNLDPNPQGMNGDRSFGGGTVTKHDIPEEVKADVALAVDSVLNTMGRTPAPALRLREALYGSPEEVGIDDLSGAPGRFEGLAVRVRGHVEGSTSFNLKAENATVAVVPVQEVDAAFRSTIAGGAAPELELTGVFRQQAADGGGSPNGTLTFWDFVPVNPENPSGPDTVPLEQLVGNARSYEGKVIRVVGKFRGNNLFGDLPTISWKGMSDFVVKEDEAAIWVTGKKAQGKGWHLDVQSPGDTQHWVEVVGRPKAQKGIVYLRASQVTVTTPPSGHAGVREVRRLVGTLNRPPEVVFALPLSGEPVSRRGVFVLQFSKPLDKESLKARVQLRYVTSEHPFEHLRVSYDEDRRALVIDPGELLEVGKQIQVILLRGITDSDGLALAGEEEGETVYRMLYQVVRTSSAGPDGP
jgi:hypothetical protein